MPYTSIPPTPPKGPVGHTPAGASFMTTPQTSNGMEPAYNLNIQKVSTRTVLPTDGIDSHVEYLIGVYSAYLRYPLEGADDERADYLYCKVIGRQTRAG